MKPAVVDLARVLRGAGIVLRAQANTFLDPAALRAAVAQSLVTPCKHSSPSVRTTEPEPEPEPEPQPPPSAPSSSSYPSPSATVKETPAPTAPSSGHTASVKAPLNSTPVSPSLDTASIASVSVATPASIPSHFDNNDIKHTNPSLYDPATTVDASSISTEAEDEELSQVSKPEDMDANRRVMRERRVPQTAFSRIAAFGGLGASLLTGAAAEITRRAFQGRSDNEVSSSSTSDDDSGRRRLSPFVTEANAARLADTLSRMRGAALKLGQMLSIQDETVIPPQLSAALQRVRQNADIMPTAQLNATLAEELGADWRDKFVRFDEQPMAAASIGQVHRAAIEVVTSTSDNENDGDNEKTEEVEVVLKVQYPGVAQSIQSDVDTLRRLLRFANLVPDSYYVNEALEVAQHELHRECDYAIEASNQMTYRDLIINDTQLSHTFRVPKVFDDLSTKRILTSEYVPGVPIDRVHTLPLETRDRVATDMLKLTMRELFMFGFQQSDPNWANYLYDDATGTISLIDFGAARPYPEPFLKTYLQLIIACADRDEDAIIQRSVDLGFLTGEESKQMMRAHVSASLAVGEPFQQQTDAHSKGFNFDGCDIPKRTSEFGKVMLDQRLTPPPKEAYSLHRRLSGAFLLGTKLRATVDARGILDATINELKQSGRY